VNLLSLALISILISTPLVRAAHSDPQQDLFLQANSAETHGQAKKAIAAYEKIIAEKLATDPQSPLIFRSRVRIARLNIDHGQMESAEHTFREALNISQERLKLDPELMVDMDDLADSYVDLSAKQNTKECLLHVLALRKKIDPHHPIIFWAYRHLATYAHTHGDNAGAINYIKAAIEIEKKFPAYKTDQLINDQLVLSSFYIAAKEIGRAEFELKQTLQIAEKFPNLCWSWSRCHYELGRCLAERYEYDKSDRELQMAMQLSKKYPCKRGDVSAQCLFALQENATLRIKNKAKVKKLAAQNCRNAAISAGVGKSITTPSKKG